MRTLTLKAALQGNQNCLTTATGHAINELHGRPVPTKGRTVAVSELANEQIRLVQLSDALSVAQNLAVLRKHVLTAVSMGAAVLYWAIPCALSAFAGPDGFRYDFNAGSFNEGRTSIGAYGRTVALEQAAGLTSWIPQPAVRFVRLDAAVAEELLVSQRARAARFPDGLHMLDGTAKAKKLLVVTTFSTPIRVAPPHMQEAAMLAPGMPATETPDTVDILLSDVYVKESFVKTLRERLDLYQGAGPTLLRRAKGQQVASAQSSTINQEPLPKPAADDDPYKLKERMPAVYALYRTAELCNQNPEYVLVRSAKSERRRIANEVLKGLAEPNPGLSEVFKKTRRAYATVLIDPLRDPNEGLAKKERREWPTPAAQELLLQSQGKYPSFVYTTLMLTIHAAEQWLAWKAEGNGSRLLDLESWLKEHGLSGTQERATLIPVITFDGARFQSAPESAEP